MRWTWSIVLVVGLLSPTAFSQYLIGPGSNNGNGNNDDGERANARRAAVQQAQGEVDRAQATLQAVTARIEANWKANPEMLAATKDLQIKQEAFDQARKPLIEKLKTDPAYKAAATDTINADARVKNEQANALAATPTPSTQPTAAPATLPAVSPEQVQAAKEKLAQKSTLREMEAKAIENDPTAKPRQLDLDASREKMKVLQLQFDATKLNDAEYKSALDQLNSAKSRLTAAAGQN